MQFKHLVLTAGLLLGSASIAAAAPAVVTSDLNLRSGPGTNYGVVNVLPGGTTVDVLSCSGSWCRVGWGNSVGYASSSYLDLDGGGPAYVAAPPVFVAPPVFGYGYGYGYGYRSGPRWHAGSRNLYRGGRPHFRGARPGFRGAQPGFRSAQPGFRGAQPSFRGVQRNPGGTVTLTPRGL